MSFVHLHVHSAYSPMRGTASLEELCRRARELGMERLALTDTNNLYGLIFFLEIAAETGLRPIIGAEAVSGGERAVLLVRNRDGYAALCRLLSRLHCRKDFSLAGELDERSEGLVVLTDSIPLLRKLRGRQHLYAELRPGYPYRPVLSLARRLGIPYTASGGVYFTAEEDYQVHRLLRAIDLNTTLSRLPRRETAPPQAWLMSPREMARRFPHLPEALENTLLIAEECCFQGEFGRVIFSGFEGLDQNRIQEKLRRKTEEGAMRRYGDLPETVHRRIDYELGIIGEKGFGAVFLVMEDIVRQAPLTCGRGSAAASIVSYCLGITHVDPIQYNLYFERFLNPGRTDPPDIDVDFPWDERDGVLDYVFDRYGAERAAMVANQVGFRARAAVREVAKVYGLPEAEIKRVTDRLAQLWYWSGESVEEMMRTHPVFQGLELKEPWPRILDFSSRLNGMMRHISVHCGGVVITPDEITSHVPVEIAPKGIPVIQWEKDQTESSGLVKIDLLGNRSLAVIRDALAAIHENTGRVIAYDDFNPLDDRRTQELIARGDTLGVFYVESPATRQLQKKARVGDYEHLVIHSSIIRPAANPFINEYVRRLRGDSYEPIHPILDEVLRETYGIMVYQEDVTRVAVAMAGFSPQEGDGLRKTLSKKRNHRALAAYRERFFQGAAVREIPLPVIEKVWEMILSFGGYSFCKPHSASYAMVSFKSAYLRAHYPAEFMAAVLSNRGGYYSTFAYLSECRRMGLRVLPPDINLSRRCFRGKGGKIRVGLMQLKGLKSEALEQVLEEREQRGPYRSFEDVLRRIRLDGSDLRILIKGGCLDSIAGGRSRAQLLWETEAAGTQRRHCSQEELDLFCREAVRVPDLGRYDFRTMLLFEVEALGFPLSVHPLDLYEEAIRRLPHIRGRDLERNVGRRVTMIGWWITNKMVYTSGDEPMAFISFEDRTALYETIFFPPAFRTYASRFSPVRPYILRGRVEEELGAVSLRVEEMEFLGGGDIRRRKANRPGERTRLPAASTTMKKNPALKAGS